MLKLPPKRKSAKALLLRAIPPLVQAVGFGSMQKLIISQAQKKLTEQQASRVLDILKVMLEEW